MIDLARIVGRLSHNSLAHVSLPRKKGISIGPVVSAGLTGRGRYKYRHTDT